MGLRKASLALRRWRRRSQSRERSRKPEALKKAKVWSTELTASRTFIVLDDEDDTQADMEQEAEEETEYEEENPFGHGPFE